MHVSLKRGREKKAEVLILGTHFSKLLKLRKSCNTLNIFTIGNNKII